METKRYIAAWYYKGPKSNLPGSFDNHGNELPGLAPHDIALENAVWRVHTLLHKAGWGYEHAYMWPDGSLYTYIRSDFYQAELERRLRNLVAEEEGLELASLLEGPEEEEWLGGIASY